MTCDQLTNRPNCPGFTCRLEHQTASPTSLLLPSVLSVCCGEEKIKERSKKEAKMLFLASPPLICIPTLPRGGGT